MTFFWFVSPKLWKHKEGASDSDEGDGREVLVKIIYLGEMMLELSVGSLERVNPKWGAFQEKEKLEQSPESPQKSLAHSVNIHGTCLGKSCQQQGAEWDLGKNQIMRTLVWNADGFKLNWRVLGIKKDKKWWKKQFQLFLRTSMWWQLAGRIRQRSETREPLFTTATLWRRNHKGVSQLKVGIWGNYLLGEVREGQSWI